MMKMIIVFRHKQLTRLMFFTSYYFIVDVVLVVVVVVCESFASLVFITNNIVC